MHIERYVQQLRWRATADPLSEIIFGDISSETIVIALYHFPIGDTVVDTGDVQYVLVQKAHFQDRAVILTACQCEEENFFATLFQCKLQRILSTDYLAGMDPVGRCMHQEAALCWLTNSVTFDATACQNHLISQMVECSTHQPTYAIYMQLKHLPNARRKGSNFGKSTFALWNSEETVFYSALMDRRGFFKGLCCRTKSGHYCSHVRPYNYLKRAGANDKVRSDASSGGSDHCDSSNDDRDDEDLRDNEDLRDDEDLRDGMDDGDDDGIDDMMFYPNGLPKASPIYGANSPIVPQESAEHWLEMLGTKSRARYAGKPKASSHYLQPLS